MILGIITAVFFLLAASRCIYKKAGNEKFRKAGLFVHKGLGIGLIAICFLHMILTLPLIRQRPIVMYFMGIVMLLLSLMELFSYFFRKRLKGRFLWIHRAGAIGILCCMVVHVAFGILSLQQYQQSIRSIVINPVEVSGLQDGNYIGECDAGYVYAKVEVTIADGGIQEVKLLEHRTERGKPAEVIVQRMAQEQRIDVDAVSGATNSSRVIERAVCNALEKEGKRK